MKRITFILLSIVATLCCCKEQNPPSSGGGSNSGGGSSSGQNVTVDFTYQLVAPFMYSFTNTSKGADSYKWDFGDGTWANGKDAMHVYETAGTYKVTLTATANGIKYDKSKSVVVKEPSIYIAGYKLYKIPYQNKYYKVVCKDDDWFGTDWGFTTIYTPLLDDSDIPYVKYFSQPLLMDKLDGDNYYTFYVYYSSNTSSTSNDVQCMKQKLTKQQILEYKDEHLLKSDNGQTQIGIIMEYR